MSQGISRRGSAGQSPGGKINPSSGPGGFPKITPGGAPAVERKGRLTRFSRGGAGGTGGGGAIPEGAVADASAMGGAPLLGQGEGAPGATAGATAGGRARAFVRHEGPCLIR